MSDQPEKDTKKQRDDTSQPPPRAQKNGAPRQGSGPKAQTPKDTASPESSVGENPAQGMETSTASAPDAESGQGQDGEADQPGLDTQAEISQLKDQLLRVMAEMENLRRRSARELEDRLKYAAGPLASDLLPVADNLERALSSVSAKDRAADQRLDNFAAGIEAVLRDFLASFEKNALRRIDPLGQAFNPEEHEAMMKIKDETHPPGTVVQVMQPGYRLHDRLLRPAMVGVAEGGPAMGPVDETV